MKSLVLSMMGSAMVLAGCSKIKHLADINVDIPYNAVSGKKCL